MWNVTSKVKETDKKIYKYGAKRVAELCKNAGLVLTGAGSAYPYHKDPQDSHLRIAPTYPSLDEVETASELLCVCVRLAVVEKLLADMA